MVSAERVLEYGKLPPELEQDIVRPPNDWPDKGHIQITDLCYKHSTNGPTVLRNINCTIQPGEKVIKNDTYIHHYACIILYAVCNA